MKILYLKNSQGYHADVLEIMGKLGHSLDVVEISEQDEEVLSMFAGELGRELLERFDASEMVFSLDYYPTLAEICNKLTRVYVSWSLEPPFSSLFSASVAYPTNRIFLADKYFANILEQEGVQNVWYLSEGVNLDRCERTRAALQEQETIPCSFIGKTKIETWERIFKTDNLLDASQGYMEGLVASQNYVYGIDLFEGSMPEYLMKDLMKNSPLKRGRDSVETMQSFYAQQCFYPRVSAVDATIATRVMSYVAPTHIFTDSKRDLPNLVCMDMPRYEERLNVYGNTEVNVVLTPRGFKDGLYGQMLQIMGMGGFLITDYRPELAEVLKEHEICWYFESMKDLAEKIKYMLTDGKEERIRIAESGRRYVELEHDLEKKLEFINRNAQ